MPDKMLSENKVIVSKKNALSLQEVAGTYFGPK